MRYEIGLAKYDDYKNIMRFMHEEWRANHILAVDEKLFLYEFQEKDTINFIIAKDKETNEIKGLMGIIKINNNKEPDLTTSIWKVSENAKYPMLGIKLYDYLRNDIPHRYHYAPGLNKITFPLFKYMKIFTGVMKHAYIANPYIDKYKIASFTSKPANKLENIDTNHLELVSSAEMLKDKFNDKQYLNRYPYKDTDFLIKRYFYYPGFTYFMYGLKKQDGSYKALLVVREVIVEEAKALRVIDFIGDEQDLITLKQDLHNLLLKGNYEYIDLLYWGLKDETIEKAGFTSLDYETDEVIIPQYFCPFLQQNIKINFYADIDQQKDYYIFKGDGDQDRPVKSNQKN